MGGREVTNGEKIQTILDVDRDCTEVHGENGTMTFTVTQDFWNAEYKEPITKNDLGVDCISRANLYNRIKGIDHDEDYECDEFGGSKITYHTCDWDEVLREIEDAPSVTPQEPRKGRWLVIRTNDGTHEMTCSCCGYIVTELLNGGLSEETALNYLEDRIKENKYCLNCGADMREVKE